LPQVYQLHIPASIINEVFPQPEPDAGSDTEANADPQK
jgi:hypothetical protein